MILCPSVWHDEVPPFALIGNLCNACTTGIARDARDAVANYEALAERHAPGGQGLSEVVSVSSERRIPYSDTAGDLRVTIQRTLEVWAATVTRGRNIRAVVGDLSVGALAEIIATHADWIAARTYGPMLAGQLRELARGEPLRVAFAMRAASGRVERVTTCPVASCGAPAAAILRRESSLRASEVVCTANPAHRWDKGRWLDLNPEADARIGVAEAAIVAKGDDSTRSRDCVRQWISRGHIKRGDDGMLSLAEVGAYARTLRDD